jgi:hypothetical protein
MIGVDLDTAAEGYRGTDVPSTWPPVVWAEDAQQMDNGDFVPTVDSFPWAVVKTCAEAAPCPSRAGSDPSSDEQVFMNFAGEVRSNNE